MNHTKNIESITVRYIYSACVVTTTPDITILHDPWFTEGVYDGSWFQYPRIADPLQSIGDVDAIYVSHIHPDHYDGTFIKEYFQLFGTKVVLIADHAPNYLAMKMRADGIEPTVLREKQTVGRTSIQILPHKTGSISDVDSAIIIKYQPKFGAPHCVVNVNDIIFDDEMLHKVKTEAGEVDILLCGYTGAGPYPQTYFDTSDPNLINEASKKKMAFFERYKLLTTEINAKINIPFAGKYILGGKLSKLNDFRGVADPVEVVNFDNRAIVLADNGGEINTITLKTDHVRTVEYGKKQLAERIQEVSTALMAYEKLFNAREIHQLPLRRLLESAAKRAVAKSECDEDYFFIFRIPDKQFIAINANRFASQQFTKLDQGVELPTPRSEIIIDPRYLFGLLTGIYHWNNAEVGSQFETRRFPNKLNREAQNFLNYLSI